MTKFRLGVAFNVFDNFELIKASISPIREYVDYVSVVYQNISNYNNSADANLLPYLEYLKNEEIINEIVEFIPKNFGNQYCHSNEMKKRELGQKTSWLAGCTHHLDMDTDECYDSEQFEKAWEKIKEFNYDASYCKIQDFKYNPTYKLKELANYYLPFIHKITCQLVMNAPNQFYADPTRKRLNYCSVHEFGPEEIVMNHFTLSRYGEKGLYNKFNNSSARVNFKNIEQMVSEAINFKPDETVEIVSDKFGIIQTFEDYRQWKNGLTSFSNSVTI